ncbi:MAG: AAA family ATPase, partial [Verrucomicrobia bacterium]|nr:AAA family ATPase [Verrucomicrobiota bacterium]
MSDSAPSTPTLCIFISSPGDVAEEREKARQVLAQLQTFYGEQVLLLPVLWEDLPLELDQPFQKGIDVILGEKPIDIAVFILWARLGSPLGKAVRDKEGNPYRSGTEREFDLMLAALEQSGGKRPDILFYRRDDDPAFKRKLSGEPDPGKMRELMTQSEMAQSFVQEHFQDEEGHNTRAYHRFRQPVEFASRLKVHLRGLIDQRIDAGETQRAARWTEAPYRGLEVFDLRHADIFFGREAEVCELENRLRQRESEGCAFVAVIGASGSGKSSLARAGLQASLTRFNLDQSVKEWRSAVLLPAQTEGHPLLGLIQVLPDLAKSGLSATEIAEAFAESPSTTVKTVLKPVFQPSTKNEEPRTKLLVIIDQFEELFTDPRIAPAERDRFLLALEALARSGFCWVVITMRSDFYPVAQKNEIFLRLKGETGHFDLLPPGPEALRRIITEPARMAGLRFEKRAPELGGQSLVGRILEDAKGQPDMLPLLSDLLLELYQLRSKENVITFTA